MESVSIIIVNYNGSKHLEKCLSSINSLDYPSERFEVIVFDNGSKDNSLSAVKRVCPSATVLENPRNIGFAAPHRLAARVAKGNVLAFLNNDMRVDSKWLKEGVSPLNPSKGIVCSSSKIKTWEGKHVEFQGGSLQYLGYADQVKEADANNKEGILFPCGGAMFILKEVFLEAGCFDDDYFAIFEDVDLGWRLWLMGYRVVLAPDSIVYHRGHSTLDKQGQEKKRFLMHRNALMTIIKNYGDDSLRKVLPLALILAVKRTLLFMGINKQTFYFWEEQDSKVISPPNYEEGCIHLAALDDVFEAFPSLIKKRERVQKMRKRDDPEIFHLFKDPFRNLMGYTDYLLDEVSLFGHFSLDEVFHCKDDYKARLREGTYYAEKILQDLRTAIQNKAHDQKVITNETGKVRQLAGKFSKSLVQDGFGETLKKVAGYLISSIRS